ncbi:hypothetical protein GCM10022230_07450 [Pseudoclavibacter caeni]
MIVLEATGTAGRSSWLVRSGRRAVHVVSGPDGVEVTRLACTGRTLLHTPGSWVPVWTPVPREVSPDVLVGVVAGWVWLPAPVVVTVEALRLADDASALPRPGVRASAGRPCPPGARTGCCGGPATTTAGGDRTGVRTRGAARRERRIPRLRCLL